MKVISATLIAILAVGSVSTLRQYPKKLAQEAEYERYSSSYDSALEPPRPEEFEYFKSASEPKRFDSGDFFGGDEHYLAFFSPPAEKKRPSSSGGKSHYHSEAKRVPEEKPFFDASEQVEHKESQESPEKAEEATEEKGIRCVKINTKPVTADDVYKGRFRRAAKDKTMTCFKCEDLKKGGTYQKCSYGTNPDNKAFFISHEKSVRNTDKPKNYKFGPDRDDDEAAESREGAESKVSKARESFYQPSAEYLKASESIGKYMYDGESQSSNTNFRYEIPESTLAKSRIPDDKPSSDHYQPSPSYFRALKQVPDGDHNSGKSSSDGKRRGKSSGEEKYAGKPTEHRYSSYGEKESSKGKKGSSEEESGEDDRSGSPSEYNYDSHKGASSGEDEGSDEHEGKPTHYSFTSSKKDPTKTYSYYTTDPPVEFYYETNKKDAAPSQPKEEYAPRPKSNEYFHSSSKKQPTKLYSYETTDKPVTYSYRTESKSKPKSINKPEHEFYSPSEYQFSKTVEEPPREYYESSSYGNDDDKPAEETIPYEHSVEPPKHRRQSQEQQPEQIQQHQKKQQQPQQHAPQNRFQVREFSTSQTQELPDTFVAQPSDELKKALGEFHQKDRSNCTKVQREKMTCWQCIDKTGAKHEECMYVASSEPKVYQTAYSDRKEQQAKKTAIKPAPTASTTAASKLADQTADKSSADQKQVRNTARQQRRRPAAGERVSASTTIETRTRTGLGRPVAAATSTTEYSRVAPTARRTAEPAPAASRRGEERRRKPKRENNTPAAIEEEPKRGRVRDEQRRRKPKEPKAAEPTERKEVRQKKPAEENKPPPPKPDEFEVTGSEGAFSAETRQRYNKRLGMSLPEYMLTKSEFEAEFDRAVQAG